MTGVFIGLGSNLGDRLGNLASAIAAIEELPDTRLLAVSEVVESEPWGVLEQPPFANAVALFAAGISLGELLTALKSIEARLGRVPAVRFGPRTIDLDILLAGAQVVADGHLSVPHPRLAEREFALIPLLEIDPTAAAPDGTPFDASRATAGRITGRLGAIPGYEHRTVSCR